jgi:Holliday junction DNA helicase RuvB
LSNILQREAMFRLLSGNPTARKVAEKALTIEDEEEPKPRIIGGVDYHYGGWEWFQVQVAAQTLNSLVTEDLLVTGGARNTYKSNSSQTYKLADPELIRDCLAAIKEAESGTEDTEIPPDLFDFIIGHDNIKSLFWRSLKAEQPVHVLMVGPPACSKSMFLSELARLPFSRFTNGGGTSKAGLADYLLEFRPRYLIIDEIDKMALADMSILLSLMQDGVVTRLKKRMREMTQMKTWVFAAANRSSHIWPELRSRFFEVELLEYSLTDFTTVSESVLINREKTEPDLAKYIAAQVARHTRDVREAIHFGRLAKSREDVDELLKLKWPERRLC